MCAFDLLTTVAGKLLLEGESTSNSSGKDQSAVVKDTTETVKEDADTPLKENHCNERCQERGFFISQIVSEAPVVNHCLSKSTDALSGPASVITSSDCSEKLGSAEQFINGERKTENRNCSTKVEHELSGCGDFSSCTLGAESKKQLKINLSNDATITTNKRAAICSSEFHDPWDRKRSMLVASDNTVKLSLSTDLDPFGSFPVIRNDVQLANKDDDEKSCGCTQPSTRNKAFMPAPRVGDWRMRKLQASKYWEVNPQSDDEGHVNVASISPDNETRHVYQKRDNVYTSERSQRDFPFKKRKLYYCNSFSNSDGGSSDGICSSPTKDLNRDASGYSLASSGARAAAGTSIAKGASASFRSNDSHVKLKIKSFRVPELFVEIPENATVGSLKRTVMEAVTAILGGGLRIGVVFQGKKVRDDNKTLLQTGISHDYKFDALSFSLEPNPVQTSQPLGQDCRSCVLPYETPQRLTRCPSPSTAVHTGIQQGRSDDHTGTSLSNFLESDRESAPSPHYAALEKISVNSRALVPLTAVNAEALSAVPLRKPKRSEATQRRIRRPFSVSEVEALVQAVEKLGTGRWRDVKLRAFDNAKHRTYVDLKDKWKTLVHTARISPQQRRGEPVPQELLDRVLTAHAYWSQQQAKQQMKQPSETYLLL
uniref:Putative telomere repeat-binding protein 5-like n=1 Tax=Solanum chacoense TaxID=4108 RepID=A0A0V0IPQ5_SOLCH